MLFSRQNRITILLVLLAFASGTITTHYVLKANNKPQPYRRSIVELRGNAHTENESPLIKPLFACETTVQSKKSQFSRILKPRLNALIDVAKQNGQATQVSIYFDTRDGRWFSINGDEQYFPASLLKIPVMMAWLKLAESDPDILSQPVTFSAAEKSLERQYFPPTHSLRIGETHTIDGLIEQMIRFSDNDALNLLLNHLPSSAHLAAIFTDLGLPFPHVNQNELVDFMQVKSFASLFRVLYNASYLSDQLSEKAMALLTNTTFNDGLTTWLPPDLKVAHKFGEYTLSNAVQELHDCGIIYHPKQPYLLCIMTKGNNPKTLTRQIQTISKTVYDFMETELQPE